MQLKLTSTFILRQKLLGKVIFTENLQGKEVDLTGFEQLHDPDSGEEADQLIVCFFFKIGKTRLLSMEMGLFSKQKSSENAV